MPNPWSPVIYGHRGARGMAPENTIPSFDVADELRLPGTELDVHLTRDGYLVVIHDHTVDRTTDGTGRVEEMTYAQVVELNAAAGHTGWVFAQIPTLDEVLGRYGRRFLWQVEIKVDEQTDVEAVVRASVSEIKRHDLVDRTLLISFDPAALEIGLEIAPELPRSMVTGDDPWGALENAKRLRCSAVCFHQGLLEPEVVDALRSAELQVIGWQGNTPEELERLRAARADGFSSDRPDFALAWLAEHGHSPILRPAEG